MHVAQRQRLPFLVTERLSPAGHLFALFWGRKAGRSALDTNRCSLRGGALALGGRDDKVALVPKLRGRKPQLRCLLKHEADSCSRTLHVSARKITKHSGNHRIARLGACLAPLKVFQTQTWKKHPWIANLDAVWVVEDAHGLALQAIISVNNGIDHCLPQGF